MAEHVLKSFDEELNKLRFRLIKMGTLVQQQIEYAINSILDNNKELAKIVLDIEDKVDKLDLKIDKQCLTIFALHQPVAMDLRLVLSSVSINDNMELIGDFAANIAKNTLKMKIPSGLIAKTELKEMSKIVEMIINNLMDSFVYMNIDLALESIKLNSDISSLYKKNFTLLVELMKSDCKIVETCSYLIDDIRNIQAISRQAKSIAQELVFLFEAKIIKHKSVKDITLDLKDGNI